MSSTHDGPTAKRVNLPLVLFIAALVALALVVAVLAGRSGSGPLLTASGGGESEAPAPTTAGTTNAAAVGDGTGAQRCVPGPDLAAPTLDLGVQPSTGGATLLPQARVDRLVGLAADAGASVISTGVSWRYLQPTAATPPDRWRYGGVDRVIQAARARGLQVRVQLIGTPRWASDQPAEWTRTTPPTTDAELQRWTSFVSTFAARMDGQVDYLEIWNEPNGDPYWAGAPDPAAFARLMAASYQPVKTAAPDVQVVTGGLVGNDIGYLQTFYQAIDDLAITPTPFDLVGVHPFTGDVAPAAQDPARRYEREPFGLIDDNFAGFGSLHDVVTERGDDADLYIGAFGYGTRANRGEPSVPDATRATFATEALQVVTCVPYVRAFSWYYLHPTPFDPVSWTLLGRDLQPTLTYDALVDWAQQVAASGAPTR